MRESFLKLTAPIIPGKRGSTLYKAQYSMEFLIVMGFFLIISFVGIAVLYGAYQDKQIDIAQEQIYSIAKQIRANSAIVYYQGVPATITMEVDYPAKLSSIIINNNEILYYLNIGSYDREIVVTSKVPIRQGNKTGHLNLSTESGYHIILLRAAYNESNDIIVEAIEP